jgi:carbon-monoxide dehydrogenase small subunit
MKIAQSFTVARPADTVWAYLADVASVAACLPGAEVTEERGAGLYAGKVSVKLGPFSASFDGEATVTRDEATRSGRVEGKGVDRRGGSRSKLVMLYSLAEEGGATTVKIDADVTLTGPIAQFGRTGLMTETANILIREFAKCLETKLAAGADGVPPPGARDAHPPKLNALALLLAALRRWMGGLLRKP